jgi:hypothetical protein
MTDKSIDQYYSSVDKNLIKSLCKNNNLKNLINLSTVSDLYIFNKKNKKWYLKSKDKLLKECKSIKKKEIKSSSFMLSNLAKLCSTNDISNIKDICENLQNKISNLDNLINCINYIESSIEIVPINYEQETHKVDVNNIVSFDEINDVKSNKKPIKSIPEQKAQLPEQIKIININHDLNKYSQSLSDNSDSFIECYSNC